MDRTDIERIAAPHDSKAAKIRALNEAGVSTSEISAFLGIRYQHTYNVLLRAGRITRAEATPVAAWTPLAALDIRADGSIVLPDEVLGLLRAAGGGRVFYRHTPQGLLLVRQEDAVAELRRLAAEHMPDHASLLDVLLGAGPAAPDTDAGLR